MWGASLDKTGLLGVACFSLARGQLKHSIHSRAGVDVKVHIEGTGHWAILLVTPIMRHAQLLESSSETIFIDSTASCDPARNTVTVLLTATAAGAVPIGVMVHNSQTTDAYAAGFKLLRDSYPFCFGGFEVSLEHAFIKLHILHNVL